MSKILSQQDAPRDQSAIECQQVYHGPRVATGRSLPFGGGAPCKSNPIPTTSKFCWPHWIGSRDQRSMLKLPTRLCVLRANVYFLRWKRYKTPRQYWPISVTSQ